MAPTTSLMKMPGGTHSHTIIFLHGRGSDASEFMQELFDCETSDKRLLRNIFPGAKWVFPTAEIVPVGDTGSEMSQWFDMLTTDDPHRNEDQQDLAPAIRRLHSIIEQEAATVGHEQLVLAGISQGAVVGIRALLQQEKRLGGFIGLSTWMVRPRMLELATAALATPVFLAHQRGDPVINSLYGEELRDYLVKIGMSVEWVLYEADEHWIHEPVGTREVEPHGVDDLVKILEKVFGRETRTYRK